MPPRGSRSAAAAPAAPAAALAAADADNRPTTLEPMHKFTFLQALMQRQVITVEAAKGMMSQLNPHFNDATWQKLVAEVNQELEHMSLRVKVMRFPHDNTAYVGFINLHVDEPSKLASKYKHPEREYFKAVLEAIAQEEAPPETGIAVVSSTQLLNLEVVQGGGTQAGPSQPGPSTQSTQGAGAKLKLSKVERQQLLKSLVANHWLAEDDDGGVCIGVRSFMELAGFLDQLAPAETKTAWRAFL